MRQLYLEQVKSQLTLQTRLHLHSEFNATWLAVGLAMGVSGTGSTMLHRLANILPIMDVLTLRTL
jgi:hypothetical protein